MTNYLKYIIFVWAFVLHLPVMAGAGDLSQSFTLEGHLFDSPTSTDPFLAEATITLRILSPDKLCVLYAEEQIVNTSATDGTFNINVGSFPGAAKRVAGDSGNSMAQVFQNTTVITATGGTCPGVTSYTPGGAGGYGRYLEISVTPTSTGITDVLSPAIYMGSIPSALVSQTLQGFVPANFLRLATVPNLTQANLEDVFSNTNYPILQNLLAGGATSSTTDSIIDADSDGNSTGSIKFTIDSSLKSEIKNDGDFVVGTNSLYVDAATSRVAIGTANPSFDLSFMGTSAKAIGLERNATPASAGSDMTIKSGGATALGTDLVGGSLYLASGISTGDKTSAIYLQTATAGAPGSGDNLPTTKMTILGNGNVGIGTAAPGEKLSVVAGNVVVSNAYAFGWGNRATQIIGEDNSAGGNGLRFDTNGVERMRLNADGKVGIGTTTPALKLNVTGDNSYPASSGTAQTGMLRIAGTSNNVLDMGSAGVTPFGNWLQSTDKTALGTNYPLLLNPNGGNVGIGLANPIIKLEVVGDAGGSLIKAGAGGTRNITLAVGSNRVGMHMRNDGVSHAGITSDGSDIFFGTASSTINPDNWGTELM
ncbi:MAG TPA: hypothetical protein VNJ08_07990, partial [Bacteriovoracaceae bacterium]|nr:hypothetical protein [Bacteriovoracaceae bacterium]